ncbi:hypothetical protein [Lysobacter gummosus]|uniref:hypothetical protein n=1 Tax=Lysobacter gummosus TaxID=262324 RepID=UPI00362F203C
MPVPGGPKNSARQPGRSLLRIFHSSRSTLPLRTQFLSSRISVSVRGGRTRSSHSMPLSSFCAGNFSEARGARTLPLMKRSARSASIISRPLMGGSPSTASSRYTTRLCTSG